MVNPLFDEDYNLWVMMHQTRDAVWTAREKELSKHNLSVMEAAVLFVAQVIERTADRKPTVAEISRWLFRSPNSMSELLSRMEKRGLVRKVRDLTKKSAVRILVTEKGKQFYELSTERKAVHEIISSLSEEERRQLWVALGKLRNRALKVAGIDSKPPFPQFM